MTKPIDTGRYRALLVDLDGTLLNLDLEQFVPMYLALAAHSFSGLIGPEKFTAYLLGSTSVMIENTDPDTTNEAVFFEDFCRRLDQSQAVLSPLFERFYEVEFPRLQHLGKPRPHGRAVLEAARRRGLILVLATNPVFPLAAIEQRLAWGGLSGHLFDLLTTIENMHFCKPRPEYYLEVAAKINCLPEHCLMAGNDVREDLSAAAAGMGTFLVDGFVMDEGDRAPEYTYRGSLEDLAMLVERGI